MSKFEQFQKAIQQKDFESIKKLEAGLLLHYFIDVAVEEGNSIIAKFLIQELEAQPGLYAYQMAKINGHTALVSWLDQHAAFRNNISIKTVHYTWNQHEKKMRWADCIPVEHRY